MSYKESVQDHINRNPSKLKEHLDLKGLKEVSFDELVIGSRLAYKNEFHLYRSGGFLVDILDEYLIIKGFTSIEYLVSRSKINGLYQKLRSISSSSSVLTFRIKKVLKLSLSFEDQIIGYFKDNYALERFKRTKKYEKLLSGHDYNIVYIK